MSEDEDWWGICFIVLEIVVVVVLVSFEFVVWDKFNGVGECLSKVYENGDSWEEFYFG